jgi:hypothetical protein
VLIYQHRDNTKEITVSGGAILDGAEGVVYASAARVSLSGNSQLQVTLIVGQLQIAGNAASSLIATDNLGGSESFATAGQLPRDNEVRVSLAGVLASAERERLSDAFEYLNTTFATYGVRLVEAASEDAVHAEVQIRVAGDSPCGGLADAVLGCAEASGVITLIEGWTWYAGGDPAAISSDEYDFQTILTHELGHALRLGHSADPDSVMHNVLGSGEARRGLTAADLGLLAAEEEELYEALFAAAPRGVLRGVQQDETAKAVVRTELWNWMKAEASPAPVVGVPGTDRHGARIAAVTVERRAVKEPRVAWSAARVAGHAQQPPKWTVRPAAINRSALDDILATLEADELWRSPDRANDQFWSSFLDEP